jgi:threonylcarbamoyladenosine tRNA methylthiotransferase MtaB
MAEYPERIAPHLHICLQSGSDAVLRRMRRRWSSRMFVDRCRLVRETLDQPAITTDIIVGFPDETHDDFEATCRVSRECGFSKIHIFPFSARKGTPAAEMSDFVAPQLKNERCARLADVERILRNEFFASLVGRCLTVLPEGYSEANAGLLRGTSCRYAPVELAAGAIESGALIRARVIAVKDDHLIAESANGCLKVLISDNALAVNSFEQRQAARFHREER